MNKSILGTAFTSVSFAAFAAVTNVWTGAVNDSDWSNAGNYEKGLPSAEDVVQIPGGKTVRLVGTDSASLAVVNSLSRIMPLAADSRLQIETHTGVDIVIDCAISYPVAAESDPEADFGEVIKKGTGTLSLRSAETRDYCTSFTVEEGVLRLLADAQKSTPYSFTRLYVAEGPRYLRCQTEAIRLYVNFLGPDLSQTTALASAICRYGAELLTSLCG